MVSKIILSIVLLFMNLSFVYLYDGYPLGKPHYFYAGDQLIEPGRVESENGQLTIDLVVDMYRSENVISFDTRAYYYKGKPCIPGPTLVLKQGDNFTINLINNLQNAPSEVNHDHSKMMNTLHGINITNIHTHGLHINPNEDNVFIEVNPGESHTYKYTLPDNHAPGNHWYHDHKHGSTSIHVMGGLYGAIIVKPSNSSEFPVELSNWTRVVLLFSHFSLKSLNPSDDEDKVRTYVELLALLKTGENANITNDKSGLDDVYYTNNQYQPFYNMEANQNVIFDMYNSAGDHTLEIQILTGINQGMTPCSMTLLALDGVYLKQSRIVTFIAMGPAARASIVVSCSVPGTYYLQSHADFQGREEIADGENRFSQNLLTLNVIKSNNVAISPFIDLSTIKRPPYLADLMANNITIHSKWDLSYDQAPDISKMWIGIGEDCSVEWYGNPLTYDPSENKKCSYLLFPGEIGNKPEAQYRHIGKTNTVEEVTIWSRGATPHFSHFHVNHFQIVSHISPEGEDYYSGLYGEIGDWRDTISVAEGKTVIRYTLDTFQGEIVIHCHFLYHEDIGMMATFYSGDHACTFPKNCTVGDNKTVDNIINDHSNSSFIKFSSFIIFIIALITLM